MRVVVDHVAGSRRGQRQEFVARLRVRFGRHPECEVSFDPQRDIDASSRHAELRQIERSEKAGGDPDGSAGGAGGSAPRGIDAGWVLVDLGSSNGTYVDGHRVTETPVVRNVPLVIEFGPGGPRVRLFVGDDQAIEALPPAPLEAARPTWLVPAIAGAILLVVMLVFALRC